MSVPIATSPGRSGFGPQLSLAYDSSMGNGSVGWGWSVSVPSIRRKTDKGLPRYDDEDESDTFILAGGEDLVPFLRADGSRYVDTATDPNFAIYRYRPRVESQFARIERWTHSITRDAHWRSYSRDNVLSIYGRDSNSRVADSHDANRVFIWLISEFRDDRGNAVIYDYKPEDGVNLDLTQSNERNRGPANDPRRTVQRYPKSIRYGNRVSLLDANGNRPRFLSDADRANAGWMFQIVFDYGEHDLQKPRPDDNGAWYRRNDPFSTYRGGFEVRTYRLCQRILQFNHFQAEIGVGLNCLIHSTDLAYRSNRGIATDINRGNPNASFVASITSCGYTRSGSGYVKRAFPPLEFTYSDAELNATVAELDDESLVQLPIGVDSKNYKWVDLDGEGISGVLTEQGGEWYYKRNRGEGEFDPAKSVTRLPATANLAGGLQQLLDLNGDGRLELAQFKRPVPGFHERTSDEDWEPFRAFRYLPNIPWDEPNLQFVDLDGDGLADVLITEQNVFTWYQSLGELGFGAAQRVEHLPDEELGPHVVLADGTQTVFLADMTGDGLQDLVRIRSGEVCFWPATGYGSFGQKVSMDDAPRFDRLDQFDGKRVRLADLDGSGTTDIVYLGSEGIDLYFNYSGNQWSEATRLQHYPQVDNPSDISVVDLFGRGTMCLVWSSPLPEASRSQLRYIDLMGQKPHLLTKAVNNLGVETVIGYRSSTHFYLLDRDYGQPWVTRLPFPVQVVESVETDDRVSRNRFVSRYAYHHGYFDGVEREFRGFGMVEQRDTEELGANSIDGSFPSAVNLDADSYVPPMVTKTWFHTGAFLGGDRISRYYATEYYREGDPVTLAGELTDAQFQACLLPDSVLDPALTPQEMAEACRTLRGHVVRQEVSADDRTSASGRPYTVSERNYTVTRLQGLGPNRYAAFVAHARETLDYQYERMLYPVAGSTASDPRITHSMVLATDPYDNELVSAKVAYGRRHDDPDPLLTADDRAQQRRLLATAIESNYTNAIDSADSYRTPLPAEILTFEVVKLTIPPGGVNPTRTFGFTDLYGQIQAAGDGHHDLPFDDVTGAGAVDAAPYRRLVSGTQAIYRADDLTHLLPLGAVESHALPGNRLQQAYTAGLVAGVFQRQAGAATEALIADPGTTLGGQGADTGGYVFDAAGNAWMQGNRVFYDVAIDVGAPANTAAAERAQAQQHFFLPRIFADAFNNLTRIDYDTYDLLVASATDPVENSILSTNDYRVLQPARITDANGNRAEAGYDSLGMVVATARRGKVSDNLGDSLATLKADLSAQDLADFFADPRGPVAAQLLGKATSRIVYDLGRYAASGPARSPIYSASISRETHISDPGTSKLQTSFSYSDGLGREIQRKGQTEDGPLSPGGVTVSPRWTTSGWQVFTNKGQPARVYEPFFDDTHDFKFANKAGVSKVMFYDPPGRLVATLYPNATWDKVLIDPWRQTTWDVNDTALIANPAQDPDVGRYFSRLPGIDFSKTWFAQRSAGALGLHEQDAAAKTKAHAATPAIEVFDTLGRTFLTVADNGNDGANQPQKFITRNVLDIQGNSRTLLNALGRKVLVQDYDMLGTVIHQSSAEAGERWSLNDVGGRTIRAWDSRGQTFRTTYDALRRPSESYLSDATQQNTLIARTVYGEGVAKAADANLRGQVYQQDDQAGSVTHAFYDFKGNLQTLQRELAVEYRKTLNWAGAVPLDKTVYSTTTLHDALNRPTLVTAPDQSAIRPSYNAASQLDALEVNIRGVQPAWTEFVTNIEYGPKGQRASIAYGNKATTSYSYDERTFRLVNLLTVRPAKAGSTGGSSNTLQDLNYTYDPIGNITFVADDAQQANFFRQQQADPTNDYTYDPLYRLVAAAGREYLGKIGSNPKGPTPVGANDSFFTNLDNLGDATVMGTYTEQYLYDAVGNLLSLSHAGTDPLNAGWTRTYAYQEKSLLEPSLKSNRLSSTTVGATVEAYSYDANAGLHGNITSMPHLQRMQWDFRDQLQATSTQALNQGTPQLTWYVYDQSGQRVRKVTDRSAAQGVDPTKMKDRIYLGIFEVYREYDPKGGTTAETQTLHVMDDTRRIALVETAMPGADAAQVSPPLIRYQFGNHLGSSSLELDEQANTLSYEEYFPFSATSYQARDKTIKAAAKRYRETGMEHDKENSFSYHGARYYAPWLGRWTSCDPAGLMDGSNLYRFASNNPIVFKDPSGHDSEWSAANETFGDYEYGIGPNQRVGTPANWYEIPHSQPIQFVGFAHGDEVVGKVSQEAAIAYYQQKQDPKNPNREIDQRMQKVIGHAAPALISALRGHEEHSAPSLQQYVTKVDGAHKEGEFYAMLGLASVPAQTVVGELIAPASIVKSLASALGLFRAAEPLAEVAVAGSEVAGRVAAQSEATTTLYHGTSAYTAMEMIDAQGVNIERLAAHQAAKSFEGGLYTTSQEATANYYADLSFGYGRAGGPAIIKMEVPTSQLSDFLSTNNLSFETPVPRLPGQTETFIPMQNLPEFNNLNLNISIHK